MTMFAAYTFIMSASMAAIATTQLIHIFTEEAAREHFEQNPIRDPRLPVLDENGYTSAEVAQMATEAMIKRIKSK